MRERERNNTHSSNCLIACPCHFQYSEVRYPGEALPDFVSSSDSRLESLYSHAAAYCNHVHSPRMAHSRHCFVRSLSAVDRDRPQNHPSICGRSSTVKNNVHQLEKPRNIPIVAWNAHWTSQRNTATAAASSTTSYRISATTVVAPAGRTQDIHSQPSRYTIGSRAGLRILMVSINFQITHIR